MMHGEGSRRPKCARYVINNLYFFVSTNLYIWLSSIKKGSFERKFFVPTSCIDGTKVSIYLKGKN